MNFILMLISVVVVLMSLNFVFDRYEKNQRTKRQQFLDKLEVLKIVSKHECFGKYIDDPTKFEVWVSKYLRMKGYKDVVVTPPQSDGGKDVIATDKNGQKVYIECKLWDPKNWEVNVGRPIAQKLVGVMYGDGIKNGMIITTAEFSYDAKEYIDKVKKQGIRVELINGENLMTQLYDLREVRLNELVSIV